MTLLENTNYEETFKRAFKSVLLFSNYSFLISIKLERERESLRYWRKRLKARPTEKKSAEETSELPNGGCVI